MKETTRHILLILLAASSILACYGAPETVIRGLVTDSVSGEGLGYVTVILKGTQSGALTADDGRFTIISALAFEAVEFSAVGYEKQTVKVKRGTTNELQIKLKPNSLVLSEVVIKPRKEKYKKKGNPAVAFAERLRAARDRGDPKKHDFYSYDRVENVTFGLNEVKNDSNKGLFMKKFDFLKEYVVRSQVTGKLMLPLSTQDKVSREYFRRHPSAHKSIVAAMRHDGLDENFNREGIKRFADDVMREIDIFASDITFMQNRFVGPLSPIATSFYKFYLDTVNYEGTRCHELTFTPFNNQSFGFLGKIYVPITADSTLFIKNVRLNVPRNININYVEQVYVYQDYDSLPDGTRIKTRDDICIEFKLVKGTQGLFSSRTTRYSGHNIEPVQLEVWHHKEEEVVTHGAEAQDEKYWNSINNNGALTSSNVLKDMVARLRQNKLFYWGEKFLVAMVSGYVGFNGAKSKVEIGPLNTTFSGNSLEGFRLRLGAMTTAQLSKRWFANGYAAYGFRDKVLKYKGQVEYSFIDKKVHPQEFPIHSIRLMHKYDVDRLGQHYLYTNPDNMFLSFKRKKDNRMNYLRETLLEYKLETYRGFSLTFGISHQRHEATQYMPFIDGNGVAHHHYSTAGFTVGLRYAPGEKFFQMRTSRVPINLDAPVLTLTHTYMPRGMFGSDFEVNKTEIGFQKRFWFSAFGYTDVIIKAAKVWNSVPYPDLLLPNANLSYTIQPESYTLMNAMEFANDQYLSWDLTYWLNGALLNHVPLLRKLKWREVVSFRGLWGKLHDKNNPALNSNLYAFPEDVQCSPMDTRKPYMEIGVGLDNILTFLRVDYVWRLSYRNTPGTDKRGVRIQLHFTF